MKSFVHRNQPRSLMIYLRHTAFSSPKKSGPAPSRMTDDMPGSQERSEGTITVSDLSKINDFRIGQLITTTASLVMSTRVIVPADYPNTRMSREKLLLMMQLTDPCSGTCICLCV
jgi:hypothetical protein